MNRSHIESALSLDDLKHICEDHLELRTRKKGDGSAYAYQCQFCGEFRGHEVSKRKVSGLPPKEDEELNHLYRTKWSEIFKNEFPGTHNTTPTPTPTPIPLTQKLSVLMDLINGYCEDQNTTPDHLLPIFLLRQRDALVDQHYMDIWQNEDNLKDWFVRAFSSWFEIYPEVPGVGFVNREKENIRIDFILKGKKELLEHGFTNQYIGVEVKYLNPVSGKGFHGKSSRGVFQALSYWYSGARWNLPGGEEVTLATVLLFSNLSFDAERSFVFDTFDSHYRKVWNSYLSIANHANVGELRVSAKNDAINYWSMDYSGVAYFSMRLGRGIIKGNENVINKKRIGSRRKSP